MRRPLKVHENVISDLSDRTGVSRGTRTYRINGPERDSKRSVYMKEKKIKELFWFEKGWNP